MTPSLSPQQREEVLREAETAALMAMVEHGLPSDMQQVITLGSHAAHVPPGCLRAGVAAALPAIIGAVLEGPLAARFVIDYMERETGVPFGDMIGRRDRDRLRALAEEARP